MLVHSFHARVQGNWLAPVYPALVLLGAIAAADRIVAAARRPRQGGGAGRDRGVGPGARLLHVAAADAVLACGPRPSGLSAGATLRRRSNGLMAENRARAGSRPPTTGSPGNWPSTDPDRNACSRWTSGERYLFDAVDPSVIATPAILVLPKGAGAIRQIPALFRRRSSRSPTSSASAPTARSPLPVVAGQGRPHRYPRGGDAVDREPSSLRPMAGVVWTSLLQVAGREIQARWQHRAAEPE